MTAAPRIFISHRLLNVIRNACAAAYPEEACGILIGHDDDTGRRILEVRDAQNVWDDSQQRNRRFLIDPLAQLTAERDANAAGLSVVGFYHSHPDAEPIPSPRDLQAAWPVYSYLIVGTTAVDPNAAGPSTVRCWQLNPAEDAFEEAVLATEF